MRSLTCSTAARLLRPSVSGRASCGPRPPRSPDWCCCRHPGAAEYSTPNRETPEPRCRIPETPTRPRSRRFGNSPTTSPPAASHAPSIRIGTEHEKFGFRRADLAPPPYEPTPDAPGAIRPVLEGLAANRGEPILDARQADRPAARRGRLGLTGAGGPARIIGRAAGDAARHESRVRRAFRRGARGGGTTGARLRAARLSPDHGARRDAVDAQEPLRDDAPLHAAGRRPRARHDDADLHRAGEPRLRLRAGHAPQAAGLAGVAATGDGAVRQFPLQRWGGRTAS